MIKFVFQFQKRLTRLNRYEECEPDELKHTIYRDIDPNVRYSSMVRQYIAQFAL